MTSGAAGAVLGVVVPVYRGAEVVGRSLSSLAAQVDAPVTQVVVVVNDGSEATLAATRRSATSLEGSRVKCCVIESMPGRRAAIAAAEALLPPGPRIYLDQDAMLSPTGLRDLAAALAPGTGTRFAVPQPLISASRSRLVRLHYRAWSLLPYVRESPATMGIYAVSWEGRQRWNLLPRLHSDDKFVRLLFAPSERRVIRSCTYQVLLPADVRELVSARRRYRLGNAELRTESGPMTDGVPRNQGLMRTFLPHPRLWPAALVLLGVHAAASLPERRGLLRRCTP